MNGRDTSPILYRCIFIAVVIGGIPLTRALAGNAPLDIQVDSPSDFRDRQTQLLES
jgi:hypothetical protein